MKQRILVFVAGVFALLLLAALAAQTYTVIKLNERVEQLTSQQPDSLAPPAAEVAAPASVPQAEPAPSPADPVRHSFSSITRSIQKSGSGVDDAADRNKNEEEETTASDLVAVPPANSDPPHRLGVHPGLLRPPQLHSRFGHIDPLEEMRRMDTMMQSMFDNAFAGFAQPHNLGPGSDFGIRDFEWKEEGDNYVLRAELPNVDEQKLRVDITDTSIQISGQQEMFKEERDANGTVIHRQSRSGSFNRITPLPGPAQVDRAQHEYENGVLTVRLPKAEQSA